MSLEENLENSEIANSKCKATSSSSSQLSSRVLCSFKTSNDVSLQSLSVTRKNFYHHSFVNYSKDNNNNNENIIHSEQDVRGRKIPEKLSRREEELFDKNEINLLLLKNNTNCNNASTIINRANFSKRENTFRTVNGRDEISTKNAITLNYLNQFEDNEEDSSNMDTSTSERNNYEKKQSMKSSDTSKISDYRGLHHSGNPENKSSTSSNIVADLICKCSNPDGCISVKDILKSFNAPISEEQAWALIYQTVNLYKEVCSNPEIRIRNLRVPSKTDHLFVHTDGSVHIRLNSQDGVNSVVMSCKKILMNIGIIVYTALDYNLQVDEECMITPELEQLISHMTAEEADDEGIERDSDDVEDEKCIDTKEIENVLEACIPRVKPAVPEDHYKAVCRALVTEALELKVFLQKVFQGDTESLRIKADAKTSKQELDKLGFNDWARFWIQVVDELRRGVRLKKSSFSKPSVEYALTPYEILMEDIRTRKYNLRKVMVNGDIPPRVKKDAHALILEFIRSRPPLKKASERQLPPPIKRTPSPREQLMDSIRKGRTLKPIQPRLKSRLLPPSTSQVETIRKEEIPQASQSPRAKQRLIKVDFSLFQDDDLWNSPESSHSSSIPNTIMGSASTTVHHQPSTAAAQNTNNSVTQMPSYPVYNNENNPNNINTILRRTTYDLATQCESRRASIRRHTIVGCQSNFMEAHSMPPSRPCSRQSELSGGINNGNSGGVIVGVVSTETPNNDCHQNGLSTSLISETNELNKEDVGSNSNLTSMETWTKNSLDEKQWTERISDRLSLTLEEIVHIRSVMTKAELEGLPVGIRVKEDVERRKICFLCLRTRFSIFGPWGIQCKLCQRTVCSKCYSKMRIPTEHFRNVPVVLLSPSLMNSPVGSSTPSPSHHAHHVTTSNSSNAGQPTIVDEPFPKSLMDRLLRSSESSRKIRNTVGSAPSSPKHQRSNMSTPGLNAQIESGTASGNQIQHHHQQHLMAKSLLGTSDTITAMNGSAVGGTSSSTLMSNSNNKENNVNGGASNRSVSIMSRSMEGPKSLPVQSPARPHSNSSTLDRKSKFSRAFTLSSSGHLTEQKENLRGELMAVCNDCRALVLEIIRSSRQTRSSARNRALKNLTLDLSPVYKRC